MFARSSEVKHRNYSGQPHRDIGSKHHEAGVEKNGQPHVDHGAERRGARECRLDERV